MEGMALGVGAVVGVRLGEHDGIREGVEVKRIAVGILVDCTEGKKVGSAVGLLVVEKVGSTEGER